VDAPGYVSHQQAVNLQRDAAVLLLIEIDSDITRSIIPGKLFEYMAAGRPILGIGPHGADFSNLIAETKTGIFAEYDQSAEIETFLKKCYDDWKEGRPTVAPMGIERYSRRSLTAQLAKILDHGNRS